MAHSSIAYLGLGSNLGNREENLQKAVQILSDHPEITILKVSSFYETAPVGFTDQPDFINAVVKIETTLSPEKLLEFCLDAEKKLGRMRTIRWGPRVLDIDILMYDGVTITGDDLQVPHPRMLEREFVIRPLAEIEPDIILPNGKTASEMLQEFSG